MFSGMWMWKQNGRRIAGRLAEQFFQANALHDVPRYLGGQRTHRGPEATRVATTGLMAVVFLVLFGRDAYAYTDPGSGALLWQGLVASFFGLLFYARKFWYRIIASRQNPKEDSASQREDE